MTKAKSDNRSWIIPYLAVEDAEKAIEAYQSNFGFELVDSFKNDDGKIAHAELRYKDQVIMCGALALYPEGMKTPASGNYTTPVSLYVYVEQVDALYEKLTKAGYNITYKLEDAFWGDRMFACTDMDGHAWSFATAISAE